MSRVVEHGNAVLEGLCSACGAFGARVKDESSPVQWLQSETRLNGVEDAILDNLYSIGLQSLGDRSLRQGALLRLCRNQDEPFGLVFSFAGIYLLMLGFDAPFNRFVVEPEVRRSLPVLEKLIPRLPPTDDAGRANVRSLRQKPPPR